MEEWLTTRPWPGLLFWIVLYSTDYYLTVYSARGFRDIGHFQFDGSFELTPQFQKDIDSLRPVSRLHITLLLVYTLLIIVLWWLTRSILFFSWAFSLFLGMFLLLELAVHMRHLRNIALIRVVRSNGGVEGQLTYKKWFSYALSASEFRLFAALFLIVAVLAWSPFFLGGAIMWFGTAVKHERLAKKRIPTIPDSVANQS